MCNLSEGIVERTTERVTAQVKEEMDKKYSSILSEKDQALSEKDQALSEKDREIARLKKLLAEAGK